MITQRKEADISIVRRMNQALVHRGPDGEGDYSRAHLAMAMRRLSIIGLEDGWQPIYNEDKSLAIIANGEIYNYVELRAQLKTKGHRFSTHSDVETILHLYEEYREDCVNHLRGMFAFALWDDKRKRLILARDRMGEKPLYLHETEDTLYFASELKALLQTGRIKFEFDAGSIQLYFHYGYVPEPRTPLKKVRKLPAGHLLIIDTQPWQVQERAYWRVEDIPPLEGDPVKLIRRELEALSALVIRSDVPVGVALSGGLDSSAIATLAARAYTGVLQAFSVGYPGRPGNDEREQAKGLADALKIPFHEVELTSEEQSEFFEELVYLRDDPIADISGFGYFAVSRKAKELGIPVLLQGQGGDELFWGYDWIRRAAAQTIRKQKRLLSGPWSGFGYLDMILPASPRPRELWRWARNGFDVGVMQRTYHRDAQSHPNDMVFMELHPDFIAARCDMPRYYTSGFARQVRSDEPESLYRFAHPWPDIPVTITQLISQIYLLENGIAQGDRLSMANSIELRLPLMDYRLVETVIGLRRSYPDHALPAKHWFKKALHGLLPGEILARRKQGFAPPVREWHAAAFRLHGNKLSGGMLVQTDILTREAGQILATGEFPEVIVPISFKALVLELWSRRMSGLND